MINKLFRSLHLPGMSGKAKPPMLPGMGGIAGALGAGGQARVGPGVSTAPGSGAAGAAISRGIGAGIGMAKPPMDEGLPLPMDEQPASPDDMGQPMWEKEMPASDGPKQMPAGGMGGAIGSAAGMMGGMQGGIPGASPGWQQGPATSMGNLAQGMAGAGQWGKMQGMGEELMRRKMMMGDDTQQGY